MSAKKISNHLLFKTKFTVNEQLKHKPLKKVLRDFYKMMIAVSSVTSCTSILIVYWTYNNIIVRLG